MAKVFKGAKSTSVQMMFYNVQKQYSLTSVQSERAKEATDT